MDSVLEKKLQELDAMMELFRKELEKLDHGVLAQNPESIEKIKARWQRWIKMLEEQKARLLSGPN